MGFYELLRLGEELGSGIAMAVQDGQHSGPGRHYTTDADYPRLVMDAVDMLDFANGETHPVNANLSRWAKLRHDMGHPQPFGMKHVEIGNEEVDEPTGANKHVCLSQCISLISPRFHL